MSNIIFDLDGTIINSQMRLYKLFCELCCENIFTYEEYWNIKRTSISQNDFLKKYFNYSDEQILVFRELYLKRIEDADLLDMDYSVEGMEEILRKLCLKHTLYVVTNRQDSEKTVKELTRFGWEDIFEDILVTKQETTKKKLISQHITVNSEDIFVSDTVEDIKTARCFGMYSVAVTWGVTNKEILSRYHPDMIVDTISDLKKLEMR